MKNLLIIFLTVFTTFVLAAQNTITWKGGTPGKETAWNEARNWDAHRIPNENDRVVIPTEFNGHFAQPMIEGEARAAWVEIQAGGSLYVARTGQLTIDGAYTYSEGISIYGGKLESDGEIILKDIDQEILAKIKPICLKQEVTYYSTLHKYEFSVVSSGTVGR